MYVLSRTCKFPAVTHFTHAKAGSTWIEGILRELFGERVKPRFWGKPDFSGAAGHVFPALFMLRDEAMAEPEVQTARRFFVLRDLRDTLISRYFSIRDTHSLDPAGIIAALRTRLRDLTEADGLMEMMNDPGMEMTARIQRSWIGSGEIVLRYEDLIANDVPLFSDLFTRNLGLPVTAEEVERAVVSQRFEKVYGRKPGDEDVMSHGRKGIAGDWRNHFTARIAEQFHEKFGDLLLLSGQERDPGWMKIVA